ncbi:unnamed protein product [Brassica oleracea]|nr:unnamed protein product [Brassica napus]
MAITNMQLSGLKTRCCKETVVTRLLRLWVARTVKKGGGAYGCGLGGAEPLIQLYKILLNAPGVYGARFSGAGFGGCCVAFVDAEKAEEAT